MPVKTGIHLRDPCTDVTLDSGLRRNDEGKVLRPIDRGYSVSGYAQSRAS
jgi:hypothetical protein